MCYASLRVCLCVFDVSVALLVWSTHDCVDVTGKLLYQAAVIPRRNKSRDTVTWTFY